MSTVTKLAVFLIAVSVALTGCSGSSNDTGDAGTTAEPMESFGEALTLSETTTIAGILEDPEHFLGKTVQIEGTVAEVCPKAGCWIEVTGATAGETMRVKVDDGVIVFPPEAKGKKVVAEGEVYRIDLDEEQAKGYMEHLAEEMGETFDPSTVTGPMTIYQLKGHGAQIAM